MYKYGYKDRFVFFVDDYYENEHEALPEITHFPAPFQNSPSRYRERCRLIIAHSFIYCKSGRLEARAEGSRYVLNPGDIFIARESEGHTISHLDYPCEYYDTSFSLHYFRIPDPEYRLFQPFVDRPLGLGNQISGAYLDHTLINAACEHIAKPQDAYSRRIAVGSTLQLVLSEILHAYAPEHCVDPVERDPLTADILSYINENLSDPDLEPDALAAHFYVSRSQLNRMIKSGTGFTLWNYITQKRLSRAYYLIRSGVSNKDAAHISGFQDYSTFYKAYTRLRGFSPKDDRPSENYDPLLTNFYPLGDDTILL